MLPPSPEWPLSKFEVRFRCIGSSAAHLKLESRSTVVGKIEPFLTYRRCYSLRLTNRMLAWKRRIQHPSRKTFHSLFVRHLLAYGHAESDLHLLDSHRREPSRAHGGGGGSVLLLRTAGRHGAPHGENAGTAARSMWRSRGITTKNLDHILWQSRPSTGQWGLTAGRRLDCACKACTEIRAIAERLGVPVVSERLNSRGRRPS